MADVRSSALGEFLRSRRAALTPEEAGVAPSGTAPRRVPGLRREEVAALAGLSATYYARLEQGESHQVSDSVLEAVSRALRLSDSERLHLARLAVPAWFVRRDGRGESETVRDSLCLMVESNTEQAVGIMGRRMDLLGGNRLFHALFGFRPGVPANMARYLFLDPVARDFYPDWRRVAVGAASYLRADTGERPDDPDLARLIGELSVKSPDFVRVWTAHHVLECSSDVHTFRHPAVGLLTLHEQSLSVPDRPGQRIVVLSGADPDQAARLKQLEH